MGNVIAIFKREVLSLFVSPVVYFVTAGFALLGGYFFFNLLGIFNLILQRYSAMPFQMPGTNLPNLNQWVIEGFYQTLLVVLVFLIPLLTMRTIAEEKRRGTFELLITSPVSVGQIVWGKFLGVAFVVMLMLSLTLVFPLLLWWYGNPEVPPIFTGFLGLSACALGFASIGMAVSSFTENQIVAGVASMVTLLLLYVINSPAESMSGPVAAVLNYLSPVMQVRDLLRGVVTLGSLTYFGSMIALGLFVSMRALDAQRWR
jgi:ABC-2 type transport system permease protein